MDLAARDPMPAPSALVAAGDRRLAERLSGDLLAIGYLPLVALIGDSLEDLPSLAVILVVLGQLATSMTFSRAVRASAANEHTPLLWVTPASAVQRLPEHGSGFDDFIEVPYTRPSLRARLEVARARTLDGSGLVRHGPLALNPATFEVWIDERALQLTFMEYRLLAFLAANQHRVHTRNELLQLVWGPGYRGGARTVDVHVRRLRAKLGAGHEDLIETTRNVGYRMVTLG